jgi:hypothetical protein
MLSAHIRQKTVEINPFAIVEIHPIEQTSPTNYALKNNSSMFDPSMMSQTPPGIFTNTLKERMRTYYKPATSS